MDLTKFTSPKKQEEKEEILLENIEVKITKKGDYVDFYFKKEGAIEKYQDFLFLAPTKAIETDSKKEAEDFFKESKERGVEGLMFKNLNSKYIAGLRVGAMAKLKETKEDIDVVIVGAEHGKGKRAGFYSSFLVAVRDDSLMDDSSYVQIGKVSSGIKEIEQEEGISMEKITSILKPLKIKEKDSIVYFEPRIIIQVRYQEIQKSPSYSSGYALRFPRIITLRDDKSIDEINTLSDIEKFSKI